MAILEFNQKYTDLIRRMNEQMNEPENDRYIIDDGVMKPSVYFSKDIRLAWMLKEPYDGENGTGGGWSYFGMFPENKDLYLEQFHKGHKSTWHPMIYVTNSINNNFIRWEQMNYIRDQHDMCDVVRHTAFINSQKLPSKGVTNTDFSDLWQSIALHSPLLKEQINLLDPNVFIFGSTANLYEKILDLDLKQLKRNGSCLYLTKENKLNISAYHPSQRSVVRSKYVNDIVEVVELWHNNKL